MMSDLVYKVRTVHDVIDYPKGEYYVSGFLRDAVSPIKFSKTAGKVFYNYKSAYKRCETILKDTQMHCEVVKFKLVEVL